MSRDTKTASVPYGLDSLVLGVCVSGGPGAFSVSPELDSLHSGLSGRCALRWVWGVPRGPVG
jgi:hypothetical protein